MLWHRAKQYILGEEQMKKISCVALSTSLKQIKKLPIGCHKSCVASLFLMPAILYPCVSPVSGVTGGDGIIISLGIWVTVLLSHKRQHV